VIQNQPAHQAPPLKITTFTTSTPGESLRKTIELIGSAIEDGSVYPPIRMHAAGLASTAAPKDYLGQVKAIYDDFIKRWRYVKDPMASETVTTTGNAIYGLTLGGSAKPGQRGYGDCDDATTAIGAQLAAIGMPVRIKTITGPKALPDQLFTHVYPEVHVPKVGWVSVDAVGHPQRGFGWTPPCRREATWSTSGQFIGARGHFPRHLATVLRRMRHRTRPAQKLTGFNLEGIDTMNQNEAYPDLGLQNYGLAGRVDDGEELEDWAKVGLVGFGAYASQMGILNGDRFGFLMEFDEDDDEGGGVVRTKMLEMTPEDINIVRTFGKPRVGCLALGDDGDVYQWEEPEYVAPGQVGGFFRKIFRKVKKKVKKVIKKVYKKVKKTARSLVKALPGGKYLLKLHDKIHKIAMKIVKPLAKFVGKFAKKLAPIAALIPGYGPAIAAGLYTAGKIANIMNKFNLKTDVKGKPKFKSGKQAAAFKRSLEMAAKKEKAARRKKKAARKARRGAQVVKRKEPRLLKAGTREHAAAMRGMGVDLGGW